MLESLSIRNVANYDATGISIQNLGFINFIYGVNGSGKTTISKYLDDTQKTLFEHCSHSFKDNQAINTLVYNKDFRENNFGKNDIAGVFTLGQATTEEMQIINENRLKLQELTTDGNTKNSTVNNLNTKLSELNNEYKDTFWENIYKKHTKNFSDAFARYKQKESFKQNLITHYKNNTSELVDYEELIKKSNTIFGEEPQTIPLLQELSYKEIINLEEQPVWGQPIIGKSDVQIAELMQKLNLTDWVNHGRNFIHENNTCPFCQKETIDDDFRKQIEDFFDEKFTSNIELVNTLKKEYQRLCSNVTNILLQIEENESSNKSTKLNLTLFSSYLKTLTSTVTLNAKDIDKKSNEPSSIIALGSSLEQFKDIQNLITETNNEISTHNQIVENYQSEKIKLIHSIWKYLTEENKDLIQNYLKKTKGLSKGILNVGNKLVGLREQYRTLKAETDKLTSNVTSVQPTVDEINKLLSFFGFTNFEIVPSKNIANNYQIQRTNGELAESTLSEGEVTFITFLYFMQLAKGAFNEGSITDDRIIVIDDPISSLDSNVLFIVSTLIKDMIKKAKEGTSHIKQLILLTHNVYFHKEVSFIDGNTSSCDKTSYWILRKNQDGGKIQAFGAKNPIKNSYELLWSEIKNSEHNSGITIQNAMRRIIENYFKLLGRLSYEDIIKRFPTQEQREICRSLISWINDGSHSIPDDLYIENQSATIETYLDVFKDIFKYSEHIEHYNMMMQSN